MRTTIQVRDLTPEQWAWLIENLPETREFAEGAVRMCVILFGEIVGEGVHVEMPPREFVALVEKLSQVGQTYDVASAEARQGRRGLLDSGPYRRDQDDLFSRPAGADQ